MRFANVTDHHLRFDIAGVDYAVEPGAEVEIPDRVAFAVASRGIQLVPCADVEPAVLEPAPPAAPSAPSRGRRHR